MSIADKFSTFHVSDNEIDAFLPLELRKTTIITKSDNNNEKIR